MALALLLAAGILTAVQIIIDRGKSLILWAVLLVVLALTWSHWT